MKNRLSRNWLAVGVIWLGAWILTFMNLNTIQGIKNQQDMLEYQQMDDVFLRNNSEKIAQILKQRAALYKSIDSLQLALLWLENKLLSTTQNQDLTGFQMTSDPTSMQSDRISLGLQVHGRYQDLILWLQTLSSDFHYLTVTGVQMSESKDTQGYRFHVIIEFRYNLTGGEASSA